MKHTKFKTYDKTTILDPNHVALSVEAVIDRHNALFDRWTEDQDLIRNLRAERDRLVLLSRKTQAEQSEALIVAAFRDGYEAGYMHAGPKGLVLDEVAPSYIQIVAIKASAEGVAL